MSAPTLKSRSKFVVEEGGVLTVMVASVSRVQRFVRCSVENRKMPQGNLDVANNDHKPQPTVAGFRSGSAVVVAAAVSSSSSRLTLTLSYNRIRSVRRHIYDANLLVDLVVRHHPVVKHEGAALPAPALAEIEAVGRGLVDGQHAAAARWGVDFEVCSDGRPGVDVGW